MGQIISAHAYCNNEVGVVAWKIDKKIDGCLGFQITRVYVDQAGNPTGERRVLAAWVPFKGQENPNWEAQDTSVWPIQKLWWRDLTLRRKRSGDSIRPSNVWVKYEVRAVGPQKDGLDPVPHDPALPPYQGKPVPLAYYGKSIETNVIHVTSNCGDISAAFTNGFLSTQWIRKALNVPKGKSPSPKKVQAAIEAQGNPIREVLTGDVLSFLKTLLDRATNKGGELYLALYELGDDELKKAIESNGTRCHLILSNTSQGKPKPLPGAKPNSNAKAIWDAENAPERPILRKAHVDLEDRLFNNGHIGHNKFVVYVDGSGQPRTVLTGSTNWTSTGLCGQTNNALLIESDEVADAYKGYWERLSKDKIPIPKPAGSGGSTKTNVQGQPLRIANMKPDAADVDAGKTKITLWYSPNTRATDKGKDSPTPVDLSMVFSIMRGAKDALLFLVFLPARSGNQSIIAEAVQVGQEDKDLFVMGAISDASAMPNYIVPPPKSASTKKSKTDKVAQPAIFIPKGAPNVLFIRAVQLMKQTVTGDFNPELLTLGHAIIHDKIVVVDPLSPDCAVITGSHNLGYKASYGNDENLLVIRGNQSLAQAYAVHILDVYDHYKFRALQLDRASKKKDLWGGFLDTNDRWQDPYLTKAKGDINEYFG
jgi:phosphatidylserine/phosphatidylglycerophosphate/cardiolipin synthase-like enzyme